jgi:hypothetical protein
LVGMLSERDLHVAPDKRDLHPTPDKRETYILHLTRERPEFHI